MLLNFVTVAFAAIIALPPPSIEMPIPEQYQKGAVTVVHMVDSYEEIELACGKALPGRTKLGCMTEGGELVVGNPCLYKEDMKNNETFGYLMCHEKAHVNGWRH